MSLKKTCVLFSGAAPVMMSGKGPSNEFPRDLRGTGLIYLLADLEMSLG